MLRPSCGPSPRNLFFCFFFLEDMPLSAAGSLRRVTSQNHLELDVYLGRGGGGQWWCWCGQVWGAGAPRPVLNSSAPSPSPTLPPAHRRDELKRHYNLGEYWIEVEVEDLASFDEDLADYLYKQPAEHLQLVSGTPSLNLPSPLQGRSCSGHQQLSPSSSAGGGCQGGG